MYASFSRDRHGAHAPATTVFAFDKALLVAELARIRTVDMVSVFL
jgi:hypothetical protein